MSAYLSDPPIKTFEQHGAATADKPPSDLYDASEQDSHIKAAGSRELPALRKRLHQNLRQYPDFPSKGILFEDICPLFRSPQLHEDLIRALVLFVGQEYSGKIDVVVGLDARGFLFGPSLALKLGAGFVPVRKKGKLPGEVVRAVYEKEYGPDEFEMQADGIEKGQRVLVVDDIIATGGSAKAAGELVVKLGGTMVGYVFILELDFLKGREKLNAPVHTLLTSQ